MVDSGLDYFRALNVLWTGAWAAIIRGSPPLCRNRNLPHTIEVTASPDVHAHINPVGAPSFLTDMVISGNEVDLLDVEELYMGRWMWRAPTR